MTRMATRNPIPDSQAKRGSTWPLLLLVVRGRVTGAGGSRPPMAAMVVEVVEVVGAVGAGAGGVTVAGDTVRGLSGTAGAGTVTLGMIVAGRGAVVGGAVDGVGTGAVVAGVVGGAVVGVAVDGEPGSCLAGSAAAMEPRPAATNAIDTSKATVLTARTAFSMIAGRRLTPNSVAVGGAPVLDRPEARSPGRHGRQDDDVAGEQQRGVGRFR
jgi:hypothetical protein